MEDIFSLESFSVALEKKAPLNIITFATDKSFLGERLYPRDLLILKLFYKMPLSVGERQDLDNLIAEERIPPDILQRPKFKELILVIGRRGGKTFLASIIACYEVYKLLLMDNPQAYYGLSMDDLIYVVNCAVSGDQAKTTLFAEISGKILSCPWFEDRVLKIGDKEIQFQTESDKRRQKILLLHYGIKKDISTVRVLSLHTKSGAVRGKNIIAVIFDELAHFDESAGPGSADRMYEALKPSVKSFGNDGLTVVISSPLSESGKFYELLLRAYGRSPKGAELPKQVSDVICVIELATWEINILITRENLSDEELANPESFWREYGAKFSTVLDRFLDPEKVKKMFDDSIVELTEGLPQYRYEAHADPAKNDAGFDVAVGYRQGDTVYFVHLKAFRAEDFPPDEEGKNIINYGAVEDYLTDLCRAFNIKELSFDQWNSLGSIQRIRKQLRKEKIFTAVTERFFTQKSNFERYDTFKRALNRELVKCFSLREENWAFLLKQELLHLQEKDGQKVVKQTTGACTTKDLADCVSEVTRRLISEPEEKQEIRRKSMPTPRVVRGRL